ncbi:hypothetical protein M5689_005490 [Euphorbia peplus]|nr:hypothetical protein M5689_005490 [Euphorbia peplus]
MPEEQGSSKRSSSKSPVSSDHRPTGSGSSCTVSSNSGASDLLGLVGPQIPPLRFMAPLHHHHHHHLADQFNSGDHIGLNYGSLNSTPIGGPSDLNFQLGNALASAGLGGGGGGSGGGGGLGGGSILSMSGLEQWRIQQGQQFPFFGGLDT